MFQPDNLSGLFFWFKSSSITGVTNGGNVSTWNDSSASGNNVTSENISIPTYVTNAINGYPAVVFNGANSLTTLVNNASLNVNSRNVTLFSVFNSIDSLTPRIISTIDDNGSDSPFATLVNTMPSGFSFSTNTSPINHITLSASSTTWGLQVDPASTWMVRHDRSIGNTFSFGRFGAEIATGVISSVQGTSASLRVGNGNVFSSVGGGFSGYMAELLGYNRQLSNGEVSSVNDYLMQKYAIGALNSIPLFIGTTSQPSALTTLYVGASTPSLNMRPLYISGISHPQNTIPLYTSASFYQFPPITLYEHGRTSFTGYIPLYVNADSSTYRDTTLFTTALGVLNHPALTLFAKNIPNKSITGVLPLFIVGPPSGPISGVYPHGTYRGIPLFAANNGPQNSLSLFVRTDPINTHPSSFLPLYVSAPVHTGHLAGTTNFFLYNNAQVFTSFSKRLFIQGAGGLDGGSMVAGSMTLFLDRLTAGSVQMFINGSATPSNHIPLSVSGSHSAAGGISLYTQGKGSSGNIPLYIRGTPPSSGHFSMYVSGLPTAFSNTVLYVNGF